MRPATLDHPAPMNQDARPQPESPPPEPPAGAPIPASPATPRHGEDLLSEQFRSLDPRFIRAERIAWFITTGVVALGGLVAVIIVLITAPLIARIIVPAAWLLVVGAMLLASFRIPPLVYRHTTWRAGEDTIQIRRGVLWRSVTDVPRSRVQHTDVDQGPIMRWCGIAKLVIHTAGTRDATVDIPGLDRDLAFRLRDFLLEGTSDDER